MTYYIRNIDPNFIMGVYIHCRLVYLFTWLYICNSFSDFTTILVKMLDLIEFEK